jgi:hypothetical protein
MEKTEEKEVGLTLRRMKQEERQKEEKGDDE